MTPVPYGQAPAWCFPVFELSMYLLFVLCLVHACKRGRRDVIYLLGGLAFGLLLEYIEVISGMGYTYGRFMVMFGTAPLDIPLCIGVGWGIIMYTARLFSDSLGLKNLWARAALDTLLAINIDLSMDTVAYRLHMWTWNWSGTHFNPLTADWFGIPWGNFFGWQMVVFFYSAFSRLFERQIAGPGKAAVYKYILTALLALLCAQILLYVMEEYIEGFLYTSLGIISFCRFGITIIILCVLVGYGWHKKQTPANTVPAAAWWVPGWFHLYFFSCLFICGFYLENKWLTIAAVVNLFIGIAIHIFPLVFKPKPGCIEPQ
jgi:uncharacterized membrane protein